jgi:hypothetical protein
MTFLLGLTGSFASLSAFAGDRKPASSGGKTKVVYEKKTTMDFGEASVDGQFMSPDGVAVGADKNLDFDSLLDPKANFKKELKRSSGAVR